MIEKEWDGYEEPEPIQVWEFARIVDVVVVHDVVVRRRIIDKFDLRSGGGATIVVSLGARSRDFSYSANRRRDLPDADSAQTRHAW